jgi:hypothetical protein
MAADYQHLLSFQGLICVYHLAQALIGGHVDRYHTNGLGRVEYLGDCDQAASWDNCEASVAPGTDQGSNAIAFLEVVDLITT